MSIVTHIIAMIIGFCIGVRAVCWVFEVNMSTLRDILNQTTKG